MKKQIPYGIANYEELVEKNCYFVDKTRYIAQLEESCVSKLHFDTRTT